jgi:hypothetical protein
MQTQREVESREEPPWIHGPSFSVFEALSGLNTHYVMPDRA